MDRSSGFVNRLVAGIKAFRMQFLAAGLQEREPEFAEWAARRLRYDIFWAMYENTVYDRVHSWAHRLKTDYALYRYIRGIYNPAYRVGEFYKSYMMGGRLDPNAGDGKSVDSALPIAVPERNQGNEEAIRQGVSLLWLWSSFQRKKDITALWGSILGDVFLRINDDTARQKVYWEPVHPGSIIWKEEDSRGNIVGYQMSEWRRNPENEMVLSVYSEVAKLNGEIVEYTTYKDGEAYAWSELGEDWSVPYGFVPMVHIQHKDVGLDWGWSELHAAKTKFMEIDDQASKFHDHIRKQVDPPWFMSGVSKRKAEDALARSGGETTPTEDRPAPDREELMAIYATNPQAQAKALLADLRVEEVTNNIKFLLEQLEQDYPELSQDEKAALASNSSKAIRVARQKTEAKVRQRRTNYNEGIVRVHQMGLSIAGWRQIPGFEGFSLESFDAGDEDHEIAPRPVYANDPLDRLEIDEKFWTTALAAIPFIGLELYLRRAQWDEADIAAAVAAQEEQEEKLRQEAEAEANRVNVQNNGNEQI